MSVVELTDANKRRREELIRKLAPKALPGNFAWRKLEELQGFEGDYTEADHGMHWSDTK